MSTRTCNLSAPITTCITVTYKGLGTYLSFHFLSVYPVVNIIQFSFLLTIARSGHLAKFRWCICLLKSQRIFCISFCKRDSGLCIYHLFIWSNLNFLHNSQLSLVLYSFCTNLQHLLIMWLIVSSLSPHNLHLLFCCILSILALTKFLWRCFVMLSEGIQFLSTGFLFLAMSKFSCVRFCLFVAWNVHTVVFLPVFVFCVFLFYWCLCYLYCFWLL